MQFPYFWGKCRHEMLGVRMVGLGSSYAWTLTETFKKLGWSQVASGEVQIRYEEKFLY